MNAKCTKYYPNWNETKEKLSLLWYVQKERKKEKKKK